MTDVKYCPELARATRYGGQDSKVLFTHIYEFRYIQGDQEKTSVFIHLCYNKYISKQPDSIHVKRQVTIVSYGISIHKTKNTKKSHTLLKTQFTRKLNV